MSIVDNDRPPYVAFERRAVEDRTESEKAGRFMTRDVDFVVVTRPGSRDTVEKEAEVWVREIEEKSRSRSGQPSQVPSTWGPAFREAYKLWKSGEELPTSGTPIKGWPLLSPAAQKDVINAGIRTVEDLAALPDNELSQIGIGAVSFKQKAAAWLTAADGTGKAAAEISTLSSKVEQLAALAKEQADEIKSLRARLPQTVKA